MGVSDTMSDSNINRRRMPQQATDFSTTAAYLPIDTEDSADTSTGGGHLNRRQVLSATGAAIVGGFVMSGNAAADDNGGTQAFSTALSGDAEVPPVETNASGQATFELSEDGSELHFEVYIDCIRNVNQGHIHLGSEDENGPVVVWLYQQETQEPETIEGLSRDFVLAEGTVTEEDLVDVLEGESLEALIAEIEAGQTYVNIHSEQNPGGEIRGQIAADDVAEEPVEAAVEEEEEPDAADEEPEDDVEEEPEEDEDEEEDVPVDPSDALEITNFEVLGSDPNDESVTITNNSDEDIDLTGFQLRDAPGGAVDERNTPTGPFTFPSFTLNGGNSVTVFSGSGSNDDSNLYWGESLQVYNQEGDTITLLDANGNTAAEVTYDNQTSLLGQPLQFVRTLFA
jgi:hypothetical protein